MNKFEVSEQELVKHLCALAHRGAQAYAQRDDVEPAALAALTLACEAEARHQGIELVITYKGGSDEN